MSALDDTKIFGIIALVVGIISAALGIYGGSGAASYIAGAVPGIMLIILGYLAFSGAFNSKPAVVSGYLMLYGLGFVIVGIVLMTSDLVNIVYVIVGVLAIFLGYNMRNNAKNGPIWWYILVIIFIILVVVGLLNLIDGDFGSAKGIAAVISTVFSVLLNFFMLYYLMSSEVKAKFTF